MQRKRSFLTRILIVARLLRGHGDEDDVAELRGAQHVEEEAVGVSRVRRQHLVEVAYSLRTSCGKKEVGAPQFTAHL